MSHRDALTLVRAGTIPVRINPVPAEVIERPRLLRAIESEPTKPMVLVAAPAGSGKTALMAQWLEARQRAGVPDAVVWVTHEPGDSRPDLFWSVVTDALDQAGIPPADDDPQQGSDSGPYQWPKRLLRRLQGAPRPVVIILDDFHFVTDADTLGDISYLAEHAVSGVRLFLSTRFDPNLNLTKLRLDNQLLEIRLADLALTTAEVHELVSNSGLELERELSELLCERTEGWVAGVRLCLLSMTASGEPRRIVHELSCNDSSIAGYLIEQVLAEIDPELRTFLLETSILDVITPSLADEITGRSDSAGKLRMLTRRTGFVASVRGEHGRYRYHSLFADLLRNEFRLTERTRHDELQTRAAGFLVGESRPLEAIPHALAAENWDAAAAAVFSAALLSMAAPRETDLSPWLGKFPESRLRDDPRLSLVAGGLALLSGDINRGRTLLVRSASPHAFNDSRIHHHFPALRRILLAVSSRLSNDHSEVLALLAPTGPDLGTTDFVEPDEADASIRSYWFSMRAASLLRTGLLSDAREAATAALTAARSAVTWSAVDALATLSLVAVVEGDLRSGRTYCDEALDWIGTGTATKWWYPTALYTCQAWIALDEGQFDVAQDRLTAARVSSIDDPDPISRLIVAAVGARLTLHRDGNARGARDQMAGLDAERTHSNWLLDRLIALVTAECHVGLGHYDQARTVGDGLRLKPPASATQQGDFLAWIRERHLLSHVMSHGLRATRTDPRLDAEWLGHEELVADALAAPSPAGAAGLLHVRCLLTAATVDFHTGRPDTGSRLLNLALDQTARTPWRLPFYELGDSVHALLKSERDRINEHSELLTHLLTELRGHDVAHSSNLVVPLSCREAEILQYLPTALDREELCAALFISKNTLKSHLRSIYRKLGVDSRREAVQKARSLDLL